MIIAAGNGIRKIGKAAFFNNPRLSGSPSWSGNVPALLLAATPMVRYGSMIDSEVIGVAAFAGTKVNDSITRSESEKNREPCVHAARGV